MKLLLIIAVFPPFPPGLLFKENSRGATISSSQNGKATMVERALPSLRYGSATGCFRYRRNGSSRLEHASHLGHPKTLLDKCPDLLIYINPLSPEAPLLSTSSTLHDLSLVHPHFFPPSSLRTLKHNGSPHSFPHRLLLDARRSTIRLFGDSS